MRNLPERSIISASEIHASETPWQSLLGSSPVLSPSADWTTQSKSYRDYQQMVCRPLLLTVQHRNAHQSASDMWKWLRSDTLCINSGTTFAHVRSLMHTWFQGYCLRNRCRSHRPRTPLRAMHRKYTLRTSTKRVGEVIAYYVRTTYSCSVILQCCAQRKNALSRRRCIAFVVTTTRSSWTWPSYRTSFNAIEVVSN
jgi:hypothetical protein